MRNDRIQPHDVEPPTSCEHGAIEDCPICHEIGLAELAEARAVEDRNQKPTARSATDET